MNIENHGDYSNKTLFFHYFALIEVTVNVL